jgi:hypothetical protein
MSGERRVVEVAATTDPVSRGLTRSTPNSEMSGMLRTGRTVTDESTAKWFRLMAADDVHGLAKVRVASSNLVIRSNETPAFAGVSSRFAAVSVID